MLTVEYKSNNILVLSVSQWTKTPPPTYHPVICNTTDFLSNLIQSQIESSIAHTNRIQ